MKKQKTFRKTPAGNASTSKGVLVGTYKSGQLEMWKGFYNYPVRAQDGWSEKNISQIRELWLFNGSKEQRTFSAEFIGVKTRKELVRDYGYPAKGKAHGERYWLFRTKEVSSHGYVAGDMILVRLRDFAGNPGLRKRLRKWLESSARDANDCPCTIPSVLGEIPCQGLYIRETALQLDLFTPFVFPFQKVHNVWDKEVEVEKSSYLWTGTPVFYARQRPVETGKLNVLELFCGCGGTSCGFEMAGYQAIMGVDHLVPAIETFRRNHLRAAAYLGDIRQLSAEDILVHAGGPVDVVIAGIPCQGFSLNNRKRHDGDQRNTLYLELIRILEAIRPKAVVVENVSGIRSSSNGTVVANIERGIHEACGLTVRHSLLNAADYGVPQRRARVVFIGIRDERGFDFSLLEKTNGPGTDKPYVTVQEAIGDLPVLQSGEASTAYDRPPSSPYQRLMRKRAKVLLNHEAPSHPPETIEKIAHTHPGEPMYPKFRQRIRLCWNEPSPTQVSGGIRPQFQFGHPEQARGLTIRERCRIQSFPDTFAVAGGLVQGRVQTGNAVPPLLAKAIAEALKKYL